MKTLAERFHEKYITEPMSGCWLWTACLNGGYGEIKADGQGNKKYKAHRVSYELHNGPIPGDLNVDHICRNPICVNPGHLRLLTHVENTMIGNGYFAKNARKTACPLGHPLQTVPWGKIKRRRCFVCKSASEKIRKAKKRAAA